MNFAPARLAVALGARDGRAASRPGTLTRNRTFRCFAIATRLSPISLDSELLTAGVASWRAACRSCQSLKSRGPISAAQAAELRAACRANAARLGDDAALLLDTGRLPSAFTHAYFALEELAKARALLILELMLIDGDDIDWLDFWRKWTDHSVKSESSLAMRLDDSMVKSRVVTILASPAAAALPARARDLRDNREKALYVDWRRGHVTSPLDAIDEATGRDIVGRARGRGLVHDELETLVKEDPKKARELLLHKITLYLKQDDEKPTT